MSTGAGSARKVRREEAAGRRSRAASRPSVFGGFACYGRRFPPVFGFCMFPRIRFLEGESGLGRQMDTA